MLSKLFLLQHFWNKLSKTEIPRWRFIKKTFSSQLSIDSLRFISFLNLFDSVITNTFKSRCFIFTRDSILLCSFSRLFKSRRIKKYSKTRNRRSEWLYVYFIKRHIDLRSFDKYTDRWIFVFSDNERYYQCMIDNQFLPVNLMIDYLLWLFERLSSFDLENDLLSELIEFIINLSNDYLEHLCRFEFLIVFSKNSMNVLKKNQSFEFLKSFSFDINVFNFKYLLWYSTNNSVW